MVLNQNTSRYLFWGFRFIIPIIFFPLNKLRYGKIFLSTYISPRSSIFIYKELQVGKRTEIWSNVIIWTASKVQIGSYSQLNPFVFLSGNIEIGSFVMIGPGVKIIGGTHKYDSIEMPMRFQGSLDQKIIIENDVWIGANATILGGVKIGKGSIIAAGAVVNNNVEEFSIYGGVPAKLIKKRS